jgi:hypothetical protein
MFVKCYVFCLAMKVIEISDRKSNKIYHFVHRVIFNTKTAAFTMSSH